MLRRIIYRIVVIMILGSTFLTAQESSVKDMMKNQDTRLQIMKTILENSDYTNEFMNMMMN